MSVLIEVPYFFTMKLSPEKIKEIASELEIGMTCYVHKRSQELLFMPDEDNPYFDPEPWQDVIDKIDTNPQDYLEIELMDSHSSYMVMEDFADQLPDLELRKRAFRKLNQKRPFANFKYLIENSEFDEEWYAFKTKAMEDWVRKQIPT